MTADVTERSYSPLTVAHFDRLYRIAIKTMSCSVEAARNIEIGWSRLCLHRGRPSIGSMANWLSRTLTYGRFFAAIPGRRFPADRRNVHRDFDRSDLGGQPYDLDAT